MKKTLFALLSILTSVSVHAWTAIAANPGFTVYFASSTQSSPEEAQQDALNKCNKMQFDGRKCRNVGDAQMGKIIVIYLGGSGIGFGANVDGDMAARQAKKECEQLSKDCDVIHVAFAPKPKFASVVFGSFNGHYLVTNSATQTEANEKALALCKSDNNEQKCKLDPLEYMAYPGFWATAYNPIAGEHFIQKHEDADLGAQEVINRCQTVTGAICQVRFSGVYHGNWTHWTEAQAKWISKQQAFATINFNKQLTKRN